MWGGVRTAGTVDQARVALHPPAADLLVSGRAGDSYLRRHVGHGTSGEDTFDKDTTPEDGQPGITVGHEDLRVVQS